MHSSVAIVIALLASSVISAPLPLGDARTASGALEARAVEMNAELIKSIQSATSRLFAFGSDGAATVKAVDEGALKTLFQASKAKVASGDANGAAFKTYAQKMLNEFKTSATTASKSANPLTANDGKTALATFSKAKGGIPLKTVGALAGAGVAGGVFGAAAVNASNNDDDQSASVATRKRDGSHLAARAEMNADMINAVKTAAMRILDLAPDGSTIIKSTDESSLKTLFQASKAKVAANDAEGAAAQKLAKATLDHYQTTMTAASKSSDLLTANQANAALKTFSNAKGGIPWKTVGALTGAAVGGGAVGAAVADAASNNDNEASTATTKRAFEPRAIEMNADVISAVKAAGSRTFSSGSDGSTVFRSDESALKTLFQASKAKVATGDAAGAEAKTYAQNTLNHWKLIVTQASKSADPLTANEAKNALKTFNSAKGGIPMKKVGALAGVAAGAGVVGAGIAAASNNDDGAQDSNVVPATRRGYESLEELD